MSRAGVSVTSDAIRIEDEVWEEAFATRVPSSRRSMTTSPPRSMATGVVRDQDDAVERPVRAAPAPTDPAPLPARRTVTIKGRGAERHLPWPGEAPRRRPPRAAYERHGFKPDRMAMWAMVLGLLLVLIAVISAHG
jgi:hypothetical protein